MDYFKDFRRSVALLSVILFLAYLLPIGYLAWTAATDDVDPPNVIEVVRFVVVGAALAGAAAAGVGVLRTAETARSRRLGRLTGLFLAMAAVLLIVTGLIGDRLR